MKKSSLAGVSAAALVLGALTVGACTGTGSATTAQSTPASAAARQAAGPGGAGETPVAAEKNPAGDIPDSQAFVKYSSTQGGYQIEAPEGWARTANAGDVTFIDKLDGETLTITNAAAAPTAATARSQEVAALQRTGRAVQVAKVEDVKLAGGPAVRVDYTSNSAPDPVTGKQVRIENNTYFFFKNGKLATLTLWAPKGADNADQWQRIAASFRWL